MTTKPVILKGFMELLPNQQILFNKMIDTIRRNYELYGYAPLDTVMIESAPVLLAKDEGETMKQVYRFNRGNTDMALRFDLTVPLARYVSMHQNELAFPFKRYQIGKVFRGESPQKGRFREFYQCDIDIIGKNTLNTKYDADFPNIIYKIFTELNIKNFSIYINNRKYLNSFFESIGVEESKYIEILRVIDKYYKITLEEFVTELREIGLNDTQTNEILTFIDIENIEDLPRLNGIEDIENVFNNIVPEAKNCVKLNLKIARGLNYYTGTVYETMIDDHPEFGSICSGGRYDNLAETYTKNKYPGVGISIGLTRLFDCFTKSNLLKVPVNMSPVEYLIVDSEGSNNEIVNKITEKLHSEGTSVDVYREENGLKAAMKYANKLGVERVIIVKKDDTIIKNMLTGEQVKYV